MKSFSKFLSESKYQERGMNSLKNMETQVSNGAVWNKDFNDAKGYINDYISQMRTDIMDKHYLSIPIDKRDSLEGFDKVQDAYYHNPAMHTAKTTKKAYDVFKKMIPSSASDIDALLDFQAKAADVMTKAKGMIVKGRKPQESESVGTPRSLENTGTCGVCGKNVKMKNGRLVDHGFRLRYGRQRNCFGVGYEPVEISKKSLVDYVKAIESDIKHEEKKLKEIDPKKDRKSQLAYVNQEDLIRYLEGSKKMYQTAIKKWKRGQLPEELIKKIKERQ